MSRPTPASQDTVDRLSAVDTGRLPPDGGERYNRLIFERSPYLLQHAENPVDWYPWGEPALSRARTEGRPIFLSIGYSTCHWCHVMAHESFEDEEVARLLGRHFVAIKVDREERPDLDATYMAVCQMMTGSGGWPLNLCLTPELKPFFAATYLPKTTRRGMSGLIELLTKIAELWLTDRGRLLATGEQAQQALRQIEERPVAEQELSPALLDDALHQYRQNFDPVHGGFGGAPKFPAPHNLSLLLRLWQRTGEEDVRAMALQSLRQMRLGGIYDQIGFGLHRYSVDARWLVPHFEKMLYDQALAALAYLDAYQVSGDLFFGQTAREILEYIQRDLGDPEGGFCCGEDADSEGAEGTFYLWNPQQVKETLGEEPGAVFCRSFSITEDGNFEGKSIPHLDEDIEALARRNGIDPRQFPVLLSEGRGRLFAARKKRVRPHRDDKILAGWNGLAIAALARAGAVLDEPELVVAATRAAGFVLDRMRRSDGRLLRRWRRGEAVVPAFLEDYAAFCWGLVELYQGGFDPRHLAAALDLTRAMLKLFDDGRGGLFDTGYDADAPLTRGRSLQDGALPSGAAVATLNLLRLGRLCGDDALYARGERLLRLNLEQIGRYPTAYAQHLIALDYALGPATEVVLSSGADGELPTALLAELRRRFLPRTGLLLARPGEELLEEIAPATAGKGPLAGRPAAWSCRDRTCHPPVSEATDLALLLDDQRP